VKSRYMLYAVTVMCLAIIIFNAILSRTSYSYACWRVTRPYGPDDKSLVRVIDMTTPKHVPLLIQRLDGPDHWWAEELLESFFFNARRDGVDEDAPPYGARKSAWQLWWARNASHYESGVRIQWDVQF